MHPSTRLDSRQALNGDEYELATCLVDFDPVKQRVTREMRITLWHAGQMVTHEEKTLLGSEYFLSELLARLAQAGFADVTVQGDHTGPPATPDATTVTIVAHG